MHCQAVVHCLHRYTAALCCSAPLAFVGQTTALRGRDANALGGAKLFISWWRIISVHCGGVQDVWQVVMCFIVWFVRHVRSRCTVYPAYHVRWCTITKCTMWGWCAMCIMCTKWGWCAVTLEGSCDIQTSRCGGISWLHYEGWASPSQYFSE